jgi:uncharacterized protein YlxW (UPF0749 family)
MNVSKWETVRRKLDLCHLKLYSSTVEDRITTLPLIQLENFLSQRRRLSSLVAKVRAAEFADISARLRENETELRQAIEQLESEIQSLDSFINILAGINVLIEIISNILPVKKLS